MPWRALALLVVLGPVTAGPLLATAPRIEVGELDCLPNEHNAVLTATVTPDTAGSSVRLYFRRLNPAGSFYYNEMQASGAGAYWAPFPRPEDRAQEPLTDSWWPRLSKRDWLRQLAGGNEPRAALEKWLASQPEEAAEYYVAVVSGGGELLARSEIKLVPVRDPDDCTAPLVACQRRWSEGCATLERLKELGRADNLTIGETTAAQGERCLFHWLCIGIVTRRSAADVLVADRCCRTCIWPPPAAGLAALAGGAVIVTSQQQLLLEFGAPAEVTPQQPVPIGPGGGVPFPGPGGGSSGSDAGIPLIGLLSGLLGRQDEPPGVWTVRHRPTELLRLIPDEWWQRVEAAGAAAARSGSQERPGVPR